MILREMVPAEEAYFDWLTDIIRNDGQIKEYSELLYLLYSREFYWSVDHDENRAEDGLTLRRKFADEYDIDDHFLDGPGGSECSVLEMMVALADRCENEIMYDPDEGDRAWVWFWGMIENLGLTGMDDRHFDARYANRILDIFLDREYEKNGKGGLFVVTDPKKNMSHVEIWYQMHAWLDENFAY